jgi:hypothetical protein
MKKKILEEVVDSQQKVCAHLWAKAFRMLAMI